MFITLKSLLHTLLLPPGGPLLVAAAGAWLLRSRASAGAARAGWLLLGTGLASLWLLATPLVADALARAAEREPALDLTRASQAQAIVILGGGEERVAAPEYGGEPAPGSVLLERVTYAARLAGAGLRHPGALGRGSLARYLSERAVLRAAAQGRGRVADPAGDGQYPRVARVARVCERGAHGGAGTRGCVGAPREGAAALPARSGRAGALQRRALRAARGCRAPRSRRAAAAHSGGLIWKS